MTLDEYDPEEIAELPTPDTEGAEQESVFAAANNIPRSAFKGWRESEELQIGLHWYKAGNTHMVTAAGIVRVRELAGVEGIMVPPAEVNVIMQLAGTHDRLIRCKLDPEGGMCSVRLTGPRVFARLFRRGDKLKVMPTETEGVYEYAGAVPRRIKL